MARFAETMLLWVGDAGLIHLPDDLVGSSSAMPHKRNPFLLEHIQGKSGALTGHLVASLSGMHATPFTNCVAVGTESAHHIWSGLKEISDVIRLTHRCVSGNAGRCRKCNRSSEEGLHQCDGNCNPPRDARGTRLSRSTQRRRAPCNAGGRRQDHEPSRAGRRPGLRITPG